MGNTYNETQQIPVQQVLEFNAGDFEINTRIYRKAYKILSPIVEALANLPEGLQEAKTQVTRASTEWMTYVDGTPLERGKTEVDRHVQVYLDRAQMKLRTFERKHVHIL